MREIYLAAGFDAVGGAARQRLAVAEAASAAAHSTGRRRAEHSVVELSAVTARAMGFTPAGRKA